MNLHELSGVLFDLLRRMEAEADTVRDGYATGLNWYAGHSRPDAVRPRTEPAWSDRLRGGLNERGIDAHCETPYAAPNNRTRCDLVVTCNGPSSPRPRKVWIEIKGAWKHYWLQQGGAAIYRSYLLHPLVDTGVSKTHTAAHDVTKLARLTPDHADTAALLLLGFDHASDPMAADVTELATLVGLGAPPARRLRPLARPPPRKRTRPRVDVVAGND